MALWGQRPIGCSRSKSQGYNSGIKFVKGRLKSTKNHRNKTEHPQRKATGGNPGLIQAAEDARSQAQAGHATRRPGPDQTPRSQTRANESVRETRSKLQMAQGNKAQTTQIQEKRQTERQTDRQTSGPPPWAGPESSQRVAVDGRTNGRADMTKTVSPAKYCEK